MGHNPRIRLLIRTFDLQRQPHESAAQTAALFEDLVLRPLDSAADNAIWRAVRDVFAMTALSPSSLLDSLAFVARALRLVREIAEIHGHRPGLAGTRYLVRRILVEASVSGVASGVSSVVSRMLGHWSAKLVGEVATAGVSAQRMHRIGRLAVAACRPIPPPDHEDEAGATSASAAPVTGPAR
jgi:putative membrane protein